MNMTYIKIKEFADLTGVSVRTLQYYDEINLLNPVYVNEHGHRFYDSNSFSKLFIITSLKNLGMSLKEIDQYLSDSNFDLTSFIEEEKKRIEKTVIDLQLRLMRLSKLGEQISGENGINPNLIPLLSKLVNPNALSKEQIEKLIQENHKKTSFDLSGWKPFIKDLNYCYENNLSLEDPKTIGCIKYWKNSVIDANQISEDMMSIAEEFYQKNPNDAFGMTKNSYHYLLKMITEYDKKI